MSKIPLVSIAMATYNGANYISHQIRSIVQQSYQNLEIIITDDASTDSTPAVLEDFRNKHPNIKIFSNQANLGITATFEHSIRNCRGDYIAISDQDDIWEPDKISLLLNAIGSEDAIYSDSELVDKNGQSKNILISSLVNLKSFYSGIPFLMGICLPGHTLLLQGDFARYILPFPRSIMYDRWISFCAAANNGIKYLDMPLVKYRQHETNSFGVGKARNKSNQSTKKQKFHRKLLELKACENAPIRDRETSDLLREMLLHFSPKPSLSRSIFFFKNRNKLLVIKKKNGIRKILYCLKMFFKANY
jgi:glycosyltransferase involved in cell wall biosynthesis